MDRNQWIQFDPQNKFEPLCRNYVLLYVSCTIRVEYKVSAIYFVTNIFSLFSHKPIDRCVHAPPSAYISIINNLRSVQLPHTMSLLNDDVSHGSLQYVPPQWWWLPPDEEEVARELPLHKGMTGLVGILFSGTHVSLQQRRGKIRWYITTLAPSLAHLLARRFFVLPLRWYPYSTSFQSPTRPFAC